MCAVSCGVPVPPKSALPRLWSSRFRRANRWPRTPSSQVTWAQLALSRLACSSAPRLDSALNFLRVDMNTPHGLDRPSCKCP